MAKHNELGKRGEEIAQKYLEDKGYNILEVNWKAGRAEIDLIAKHNNILIFIEVKTRSNTLFGNPERAVNAKKEALLIRAAHAYLHKIDYEEEVRFDVISVVIPKDDRVEITHFEDAFFPGLD